MPYDIMCNRTLPLSKRHYTNNPNVDVVGEIMRAAHCNKEEWEWFCKVYSTEAARGNVILTAYQYFPYWKQSSIHWQVRNKAKRDIFINLIKLNSEESEELFQKWLKEGKIEDNSTLKHQENWKKFTCFGLTYFSYFWKPIKKLTKKILEWKNH